MTNLPKEAIKDIAKAVAQELKRGNSLVVSPADVATMCGYTPNSTAARQILDDPTFPPSVSLVEGGLRRYLRRDVEAWIESHFTNQSNALVRAMRA